MELHLPSDPRIVVVGCGALGSYYGARLCRDGHRVTFLLRSDFDRVRRHGVLVKSPQGDFRARPRCKRQPEDAGPADLILIGLKTTANHRFADLLPPLAGPQTAILTLQNGLGNEAALAKLFRSQQIMGGLCFVCLNRVEPGVIQHLDHGRIVLGEYERWPEPRTHQVAAMFRHAGVPCEVTDNLEKAHWEKLVWNIPFNGLGVASAAGFAAVRSGAVDPGASRGPCLTTDCLLGDSGWANLVRSLMEEIIAAAGALGHVIPETLAGKMIANTRSMGAYRPSTLVDFEAGRPLELESLFLEPWRRAVRADVSVPRWTALVRVLQALDDQQQQEQG